MDPATGDLWIADVGGASWEEIDFIPASSLGGENLGWRCYEGNHEFEFDEDCELEELLFPIHEYSHGGGRCAIIGGEVYRGCGIPELRAPSCTSSAAWRTAIRSR